LFASEEGRRLGRKVRRAALERPRRRKIGRYPGDAELVEALRPAEVLEPVLSEVAEDEPAELGRE
jgi:hypothetical protein